MLQRQDKVPVADTYISLLIGALCAVSVLTVSIIMEREKRTWNALVLSHLAPEQVFSGKLLPWFQWLGITVGSLLVLVLPELWQERVPLWPLAIALPLILTAPLPGALMGIKTGLQAPSMATGMSQINKRILISSVGQSASSRRRSDRHAKFQNCYS